MPKFCSPMYARLAFLWCLFAALGLQPSLQYDLSRLPGKVKPTERSNLQMDLAFNRTRWSRFRLSASPASDIQADSDNVKQVLTEKMTASKKKVSDIKVVSFDLDNTLWEEEPILKAAAKRSMEYSVEHYPHLAHQLWELWRNQASLRETDLDALENLYESSGLAIEIEFSIDSPSAPDMERPHAAPPFKVATGFSCFEGESYSLETDTTGKLMLLLYSLQRSKNPNLPSSPANWTKLRKQTLLLAALHAGYQDYSVVVNDVYLRWCFERHRVEPYLAPDAVATLKSLKDAGLMLGVITNGNCRIERITALASYFHFTVNSEDVTHPKPFRAPFIEAMRLSGLNVSSDKWLHVGDDLITDMAGGKGVGFKTALVTEFVDHRKVSLGTDEQLASLTIPNHCFSTGDSLFSYVVDVTIPQLSRLPEVLSDLNFS